MSEATINVQDMGRAGIGVLEKQLEAKDAELQRLREENAELTRKLAVANNSVQKAEHQYDSLEDKLITAEHWCDKYSQALEEIREDINGMISLYRVGGRPSERNHDDLMDIVESFEEHEIKLDNIAQAALTATGEGE